MAAPATLSYTVSTITLKPTALPKFYGENIVELIQAVKKALKELSDCGDTGAIKNSLVSKSIESRLSEPLKKEWLVHVADGNNSTASSNRFDILLAF